MSKDNLLRLVKHYEGCRLTAYKDPVGVWTIGYGETAGVKKGMKISQEIAEALLERRLADLWLDVDDFITRYIPSHAHEALCSFAYNVGLGALKRSTLLKKVLSGAPDEEITAEFMKWTKAGGKVLPGLVKRRQAEAHLYTTGEVLLI